MNGKKVDQTINLKQGEKIIGDEKEVAEVFAGYFANIGKIDDIAADELTNLGKHLSVK